MLIVDFLTWGRFPGFVLLSCKFTRRYDTYVIKLGLGLSKTAPLVIVGSTKKMSTKMISD